MAFPQATTEVSVLDASTNQPVAGATITELTSGEIVVADSQGYASFYSTFPVESIVRFKVEGASYADGYFERKLGHMSGLTSFQLGLSAENEVLSPVIGSAGGSKTILLDTGQKHFDSSSGTYSPYLQTLTIDVPQGALSSNYRLGLTPIPDSSDNNINLSVLPPNSVVVAEFRLNWLDIYGNPVAAPALAYPLEISMNSSNIFYNDKLLTGTWAVETYTFDSSLVTWDLNSGAASLQGAALLNGDITDGGLVAFVVREIVPLPEGGICDVTYDPYPWQGPPINQETIACPNPPFPGGTQSTQGVDDTVTESGSLSASASAEVGGPLKALGFRVEVNGEATSEWSKTNRRNAKWEPGAWIGKQGTVYVREIGYNICRVHHCLHEGVIVKHIEGCEGPFKTGVAVDTSELTDCP